MDSDSKVVSPEGIGLRIRPEAQSILQILAPLDIAERRWVMEQVGWLWPLLARSPEARTE